MSGTHGTDEISQETINNKRSHNMAQEIEINTDKNGIIIFKDEKGNLIKGLQRPWFVEQAKVKDDGKRAFFAYMVECKKLKAEIAQARVDAYLAEVEDYEVKMVNVGKELSTSEKADSKVANLEKMLKAAKEAQARLVDGE